MKRTPASARRAKDLRGRAEAALAHTPREIQRLSGSEVQKLVHDLQVHQIELEMQNEELLRAQGELEEARDRFADLYDFAPLAMLTLSPKAEVLEANLAAAGLLGLAREELIHRQFNSFLPESAHDAFHLYCRQVTNLEARQTGEFTLRNANGRSITVRLEGIAAKDPVIRRINCRLCLSDITELKAVEERRELSHALLALFASTNSNQEYLEGVVQVLRNRADCQCLGVRVVDEKGNIPYSASVGFDAEFLRQENRVSVKSDNCCCIRAISQAIEEQERALVTPGGSYRCDDAIGFIKNLPLGMQARYRGNCTRARYSSVAVVPLRYREEILGVIHLADRRPGRFPPALVDLLEAVTPLIGDAIRWFQTQATLVEYRDHLEELVEQRTRELEATNEQLREEIAQRKRAEVSMASLGRLGLVLSAAHEPAVAARAVVDTALEFCGWDACFLLVHDPATDTVTNLVNMDTIDGRRVEVPSQLLGRQATPLIRRVLQEGPQLILRHSVEERAPATLRFGDTSRASLSMMFVPVRLENRSIGVLSVQSYQPNAYMPQDLATLQGLADHGAGALVRVQGEAALRRLNAELEAANEQLRKEVASREVAEQSLLRAAEELKRSNLDLEQFGYVASHDLQEPLRAVAGYVRLLEHRFPEQVDAKIREYIAGAAEGASRMEQLISDLLTLSRLSTDARAAKPANLGAPLDAALRNLKFAIQSASAAVTSDTLPTLPVDESQFVQLFQNLIGNALKFRGERPLQVHVGARPEERRWVFWVQDNGIGIDPQYAERIFQVFQRLHTRKKYPGTGIGLAICKKIVERHGGAIWVESQPGQGAAFFFSLPKPPG